MSTHPLTQDHDAGITTIDARCTRPGLASLHLMVEGDRALIIGPCTALSAPAIFEALHYKGLAPNAIDYLVLTQSSPDLVEGAVSLLRCFCEARVVVPTREEERCFVSPGRSPSGSSASHGASLARRLQHDFPSDERVLAVPHGDTIDLNGRPLFMLNTPGHARAPSYVLDARSRSVFAGDAFGISYRELDVGDRAFIMPSIAPMAFDPDAAHAEIEAILSHAPDAAFLTRYGRVTQLRRLADDLHECLECFVALARTTREAGPVRHNFLKKILGDFLLGRLSTQGCTLAVDRVLQLLAEDIRRSVTGLEAWADARTAVTAPLGSPHPS